MKKAIYIVMMLIKISLIYGEGGYEKGKIIREGVRIEGKEYEEELSYKQMYEVKVLSGGDKGKKLEIEMPFYKEEAYNLKIKNKVEVLLYKDLETNEYYIVDRVRTKPLSLLIMIFLLMVVVIAKYKGIKALMSLLLTLVMLFYIFIPLIIEGHSPIMISVIFCFLSSVVTVLSIGSWSKKSLCALIGTLGGVVIAAILSYIFVDATGLTGYIDAETLSYAYLFNGIDLREVISAGIIVGSLGATMDVGVSIASALFEIDTHKKDLTKLEVFRSGLNIGKDIIGTMVNTLILAYLGSSTFTIILFLKQRSEFPLLRILNSEFIVVEILRAFSGSIGILVAVPITSYIASLMITKRIKGTEIQGEQ